MKKNTAMVALAVWLMAAPVLGQSQTMPQVNADNIKSWRTKVSASEIYSQSQTLPPIAVQNAGGRAARQQSLPPIGNMSAVSGGSGLSRPVAQPVPQQYAQQPQAPVVRSQNGRAPGSEIYSQEPMNLPPVTNFPVPSRTALPPIYHGAMMTIPLDEAITRVLACNLGGMTGLIQTTSADVSKAGSFKMGFSSSWFDLDRVYDRQLASNESGDMLQMPIFFNYSLTDDLELVYTIPVVNYTIKSRILWTRDISESGTGDSRLGFKYRVFDNPEFQMRGAFGLGFKFPTGDDSKGLGTGKTDFEIFTAFSKSFEKIVGHLNLGYVMTGDPNTQFYPDGLADKFYYNFGIEYPHTHNVTVMAEVNGEDWGAEGMRVEVTPGLRYSPTENFSFQVGVPIAVTNDQRYGYNYRLIMGLTTFFQ